MPKINKLSELDRTQNTERDRKKRRSITFKAIVCSTLLFQFFRFESPLCPRSLATYCAFISCYFCVYFFFLFILALCIVYPGLYEFFRLTTGFLFFFFFSTLFLQNYTTEDSLMTHFGIKIIIKFTAIFCYTFIYTVEILLLLMHAVTKLYKNIVGCIETYTRSHVVYNYYLSAVFDPGVYKNCVVESKLTIYAYIYGNYM